MKYRDGMRFGRLMSQHDSKLLVKIFKVVGNAPFTAHDVKGVATYYDLRKLAEKCVLLRVDRAHPITYKIKNEIVVRIV